MGVEIERKFLVDNERLELPPAGTEIRQGYLARSEGRSVRVRLTRKHDAAGTVTESGTLTIKGPDGLARAEFEYPIPADEAATLLDDLCLPGEVHKTRYEIPIGAYTFEVDVYAGRHSGLVTAEVELDDPDAEVELPAWVAEELTGRPEWTNAALSRPDWTRPQP